MLSSDCRRWEDVCCSYHRSNATISHCLRLHDLMKQQGSGMVCARSSIATGSYWVVIVSLSIFEQ